MKFSVTAVMGLLLAEQAAAFAPPATIARPQKSSSRLEMAVDLPPATATPVIQQNRGYGPADVRYSDFLKLVTTDRVEKVTFSSDGTQLLGVDVDGARIKIESLPNDPELLNQLTSHKVRDAWNK
jgi:cell division protease FtsH